MPEPVRRVATWCARHWYATAWIVLVALVCFIWQRPPDTDGMLWAIFGPLIAIAFLTALYGPLFFPQEPPPTPSKQRPEPAGRAYRAVSGIASALEGIIGGLGALALVFVALVALIWLIKTIWYAV